MIEVNSKRCELCGACVGVCGFEAVVIEMDNLFIDRKRCILCLNCVWVCPVGALLEEYEGYPVKSK